MLKHSTASRYSNSKSYKPHIEVFGLKLPKVELGCGLENLVRSIVKASEEIGGLRDNDILVITAKVISKALNLVYKPREKPPFKVKVLAKIAGKPVKLVDAIYASGAEIRGIVPIPEHVRKFIVNMLSRDRKAANEILEHDRSILITVTDWGFASDAGVDSSNVPPGYYALPPRNPDDIARRIHEAIKEATGKYVGVVISDTEVWLRGSIDIAIGCWGFLPVNPGFGSKDLYGKPKFGGVDSIADEVAAAAALLMGQCAEGIPAVVARGLRIIRANVGCNDFITPVSRWLIVKAFIFTTFYRVLKMLRLAV